MIQVQNLQKSFGLPLAVTDLSFDAPSGAITGLLESNGAGKTTTLRVISGALPQDRGSIAIDGAAANGDPLILQQRIGVLLDHTGIYARLSVRENLEYFGKLRGMAPEYLREQVEEVLSVLGLRSIAERRTAGFSQGEHMKTAPGRALLHAPRNLVLDEPPTGWTSRRCDRCATFCGTCGTEARASFSPATCSRKCAHCAARW